MFDVAIYTDTRADEAVDGIDGFNFQAVSEGITAQDRQAIRDNMLHRVVMGWGVDHDPLAHPPTFVYYRHGGRYLLSRGISTGVTNNGRSGNLLTEAIATSDADDFAALRPAQLFGAVNWALQKADGQRIDQWATPLELAPEFETEALCQLIKDDPWAAEHLAEFLTMVEQITAENPKRLVIVCSDPVLAQRWIAFGTLFVDAHKAMGLMIRGLVQDPMTTRGDIVAATPELGPQPDAGTPRAGVNIVDLDNRQIGAIQPSECALIQAGWFLKEDSDTALAAIELGNRWEAFLGRDLATQAAAVASFPSEQGSAAHWLVAMRALKILADCHQSDELFFYGDALIDSAITYAPQSVDEARAAGETLVALLSNGSTDLATQVLLPSLEAVVGRPAARDAWLTSVCSAPEGLQLSWEDSEALAQASAFVSLMADEVSPDMLPSLFSAILILQVPLSEFSQVRAVRGLACLWAGTPALTGQMNHWAYGHQIMEDLVAELVRKWVSCDPAAQQDLIDARWTWLMTVPGISSASSQAVAPWMEAAQLARLPMAQRAAALATATALPQESWAIVWSGFTLPSDSQLIVNWADTQGIISAGAGSSLVQQINAFLQTEKPATAIRDLLVHLSGGRAQIQNESLASFARKVSAADSYFSLAIKHRYDATNIYLEQAVSFIPQMSTLMSDYIGDAIVMCRDTRSVASLVAADEVGAEAATLAALKRLRDMEHDLEGTLCKALVLLDGALDAPAQAAQDFLRSLSDERRYRSLTLKTASRLDDRTRTRLEEFMKDAGKGRLKRRFTRAVTGLTGGKAKER